MATADTVEAPPGGALFHVSTDLVPERERLGFWAEVLSTAFINTQVEAIDQAPFQSRATSFVTSQLSATQIQGSPQINRVLPCEHGSDQFLLVMPCNGSSMSYSGRGQELRIESGDIMVVGPTAHGTFALRGSRLCDVVVWTVPRDTLEKVGSGAPDPVRALPSHEGTGTLLAMYMRHLTDRLPALDPMTRSLLDRQFTQLAALALGRGSESPDIARESVREAQLNRVLGHIAANLFDAGLSPGSVADALGISVRYLHLLFEPKGVTFSEWVRERRLQETYRILDSDAGDNQSISSIAYACGFANLSAFYRAFAARYGMKPKDVQRLGRERRAQ